MQIRAGSREGTHAHCVFHACPLRLAAERARFSSNSLKVKKEKEKFCARLCTSSIKRKVSHFLIVVVQ